MLSVAPLPIGAPGPLLPWLNKDMEQQEPSLSPVQDQPEDLSVKKEREESEAETSPRPSSASPHTRSSSSGSPDSQKNGEPSRAKRIKPIPPPLDLNARTLSPQDTLVPALPSSPADLPRECLPIRKRQLVDVKLEDDAVRSPKSPKSASHLSFLQGRLGDHLSPLQTGSAPPLPSTILVTPSSGTAHHTFFPAPPPLIPVPGLTSPFPKSPFLATNGFATPPSELHSPGYPWTSATALQAMGMFPAFSPLTHSPLAQSPLSQHFPSSSLLSPSPSYHSSSNSSREELTASSRPHEVKPVAPRPRYGLLPHLATSIAADSGVSSSSPAPSSPLLSPQTWSHKWPTPAWQCFVDGVMIRFLLPSTDTPWQKAEELGLKDKLAMKVDARNPYRYAPNGLTVVKIDVIPREEGGTREEDKPTDAKTLLRMRLSPHNVAESSRVEMMAECPIDHPFFVKDKGWCSAHPRLSLEKYGIPCQDLGLGDVCLPPNHPEAVRTPDLCDRFKKFEFSSQDLAEQFSPGGRNNLGAPLRHGIASLLPSVQRQNAAASMMSPPMSPAKKNAKDPDKPKRPMNGFMLFAKKFRLELIQQHPGKDNRAISVLLGEAWKSLAVEDRELYSGKAKVLADEQKKLYPDCWKRKRSLSSAASNSSQASSASSGAGQSPGLSPHPVFHPPSSPGMPPTPTRLAHPLSFLSPVSPGFPTHLSPSLQHLALSSQPPLSLISVPPLDNRPR